MLNPFTHRKILKKGVPGKATIVARGVLDRGGTSFNLPMTLQVYVEGWAPYELEDEWMVKAKDTIALSGWIPVKVDKDDQTRVAIDWEALRERHGQEEAARHAALAAQGPVTDLDAVGDLGSQLAAAMQLAEHHVIDLRQEEESPAERLRQLAELRDAGLITPAEYDAKRAEILRDL